MFYDCDRLTSVTLTDANNQVGCCKEMFAGCDKLKEAVLPSKMLAPSCYQSMFENCRCLSSVEVSFPYWYDKATTDWLTNTNNVCGKFTKPITLKTDYSTSRIPTNWRVEVGNLDNTPLTLKANGEIHFRIAVEGSPKCKLKQLYIKFNNADWTLYEIGGEIILHKDQIVQFRNY